MKKIMVLVLLAFTSIAGASGVFKINICGQEVDYREVDGVHSSLNNHLKGLKALDGIKKTTVCVENHGTYVIYNLNGVKHYDRASK